MTQLDRSRFNDGLYGRIEIRNGVISSSEWVYKEDGLYYPFSPNESNDMIESGLYRPLSNTHKDSKPFIMGLIRKIIDTYRGVFYDRR